MRSQVLRSRHRDAALSVWISVQGLLHTDQTQFRAWNILLLAVQRVFSSNVSISRPRIKFSRWRHAGKPSMHIARAHAFLARAPAPPLLARPNNGFQQQREQLNDGLLMRTLTSRHVMADIVVRFVRRMSNTLSAVPLNSTGITQLPLSN